MRQIANIITVDELTNHTKVEWVNYVKYDSQMHRGLTTKASFALPTLIVGWNLYKTEAPYLTNQSPDILQKQINKTLQWEFSKDERMVDHYNGVDEFMKIAPRKFVESKPYRTVDPIKDNILNEDHLKVYIDGFLSLFHSNVYLYKDEIIYIYDRTRFEITGIYLNSFRYFGYDVEKIQTLIFDSARQNPKNVVTTDTEGLIYQSYYKLFPEFDQLKRSMVLFLA